MEKIERRNERRNERKKFIHKSYLSLIGEFFLRCRWFIAFLVFVVLVLSKIHFSSIGVYYRVFPAVCSQEEKEKYRIFGEDRPVRSDEWSVHTPKYFAQKGNDFKRYSNKGTISKMNEVLDYYAPILDLTLIGKPFNLGYILFGNEYGLSFYSCMLMILLFMTAFEMFLIITKRSVLVSLMGMFFIGFAPAMQWWLVPHITIVFVYAMGLFSLGYYFLTSKNLIKRIILSILLVSAIIGFVLSIFPSCQLVCALVDIFLLIATLIRDREKIYFKMSSIILILLIFLSSMGIILDFIISSKEDFLLFLNTDYPGQRFWTGGNHRLEDIFPSFTNLFLPYKDVKFSNNSEISNFVHFAPFFLLIYGKIYSRLKKDSDRNIYVLNTFFVIIVIEIIFMCVGFSEFLSMITLFKYANRMYICYGWTATIFSVFCFSLFSNKKDILKRYQCFLFPFLYAILYLSLVDSRMQEYFPLCWLIFEAFLFTLILYLVIFKLEKLACFNTFLVMFACGFFVNPICRGASPIFNHPISKFVEERVEKNKEDLWLSVGEESCLLGNYLLANGARVLSTTHFYPDRELWRILDVDEKYYPFFNRYAHNKYYISEGKTNIKLDRTDCIHIFINPYLLKKLNVKYLFLRKSYFNKIKNLIPFKMEKRFKQDEFLVFELLY